MLLKPMLRLAKTKGSVLGFYQIEDCFLAGLPNIPELLQRPVEKCTFLFGVFDD